MKLSPISDLKKFRKIFTYTGGFSLAHNSNVTVSATVHFQNHHSL